MKTCQRCQVRMAVWCYMPTGDVACDRCVPRGCSCNQELKEGIAYDSPEAEKPESYFQPTDGQGREYPCCEWWYDEGGFWPTLKDYQEEDREEISETVMENHAIRDMKKRIQLHADRADDGH